MPESRQREKQKRRGKERSARKLREPKQKGWQRSRLRKRNKRD